MSIVTILLNHFVFKIEHDSQFIQDVTTDHHSILDLIQNFELVRDCGRRIESRKAELYNRTTITSDLSVDRLKLCR